MKQRKVNRKQISQFFNGDNENRCFIAKQWLVKQVLFEQHYQYDDFYFIDICNEQKCPDDKFGVCRSVLISCMVNFVCRQKQYFDAFFAFLQQAPDWQKLVLDLLRNPVIGRDPDMVRLILHGLCGHPINEDLLHTVLGGFTLKCAYNNMRAAFLPLSPFVYILTLIL